MISLPQSRLLAIAIAVAAVTACGRHKGYDEMGLVTEEIGEVPIEFVVKPPVAVGDITTWRTKFPGQLFAAVKTEAPCPRDIHSVAGLQFRKDSIELCFTATTYHPAPEFPCAKEVYVKYEIMRVPADVQPRFVFVGACT